MYIKITFIVDSVRLQALSALELHSSEHGRVDGDASVALAFQLDRLVLANDFAAEFERSALVGDLDEFWRLAGASWRRWHDDGRSVFAGALRRREFTMALLHARFDDRLE